MIKSLLPRYFDILENKDTAKYIICKHVSVEFNPKEPIDKLWRKHDEALKKMKVEVVSPDNSLLDLKIELANRIFQRCIFCERRCQVDRREKAGNCGVMESKVASEFLHIGEEYMLIPSYTIFFSGCPFHCVFCQNWDVSQNPRSGIHIEPKKLAEIIEYRHQSGAKNVNWVGGDPIPNLPYILRVLKHCNINIPQIWNSNMYCSIETMKLLDGVIDLYLTDFKYGKDGCARRLSIVDNYTEVVERNHKIAYNQAEMIIRHLVLPGHIECCTKPILKWIKENVPNVVVNVMPQYRPEYQAYKYDDIARHLSAEEFNEAIKYARNLGLNLIG
jgi:putative pyruvate formate lyase activating enzyme